MRIANPQIRNDEEGMMMRITVKFITVAMAAFLLPSFALAQAPQDEVVYYHLDAVGSVRATTNSVGQTVERFDYLPFGEPWPAAGAERLQFTSAERDPATGFTYLMARYLFVNAGRFTSPDLVVYSHSSNPQTWNLYVYVTNRPLTFIDPSGHECFNTSTNASATVTCTTAWEQIMQNLIAVSQRYPPSLIALQVPSGTPDRFRQPLRQALDDSAQKLQVAKCGAFYGGLGAQTMQSTTYRFIAFGGSSSGAGAATLNPAHVLVNSVGPFMNPLTARQTNLFGRFWTQDQFRVLILLHELGHQLSPQTGFKPDAGDDRLNEAQSRMVTSACF